MQIVIDCKLHSSYNSLVRLSIGQNNRDANPANNLKEIDMSTQTKAFPDNLEIAMNALTTELNRWAEEQGLEPQSADEMAMSDDITEQQRKWLLKFCDAWDAVADLSNPYYTGK